MQTLAEERFNALSHGVGILLSGLALLFMLQAAVQTGGWLEIGSCAVFGCALLLMYTSSTLYHAVQCPHKKRIFRICDHIMIYVLISGSYTPIVLVGLGGVWGWTLFGIVWALALFGLIFKIFFTGRMERLSLGIYLGMGWLAVIAIQPMCECLHPDGIFWLFAGGGAYSFGTIFFALDHRIRFFHAIWHLFVLTGSLCHVNAVLSYILPSAG
ncbi:MAG: PAQR family membrane homeostasis protein TrhA [Chlamydiia bacterium]